MNNERSAAFPDEYDYVMGQLDGTTGLTKGKPATITTQPMLGVGGSTRYIVETWQQRHEPPTPDDKAVIRYVTFLVISGPSGYYRHVLSDEVVGTMIRQREALSTRVRSKLGKRAAERRMAAGWKPTFGGKRGKRKGKK